VTYLDFERHRPYSEVLSAPYRLDCALTYSLPKGAPPDATPHKRVDKELNTAEWKTVLDKAWAAGVPHVVFTGGEPTLRKDLVELLDHCEAHGIVTGLITDGLKLGDTKYLKSLLDAGLDHVMVVLQPKKKQTWESLAGFAYWKEVLDDDIYVAAHLTLTKDNAKDASTLLDRLKDAGVSAVSLSEADKSLTETLQAARDHADYIDLPLVWDLPVPYSEMNPVALELDETRGSHPEGAGKAWLYIEPDGDVQPGQGAKKKLGNLVKDKWEKVWGKAPH
jgi:MoaA/NifB/PqqE/SkfB family radical SAM enzyme